MTEDFSEGRELYVPRELVFDAWTDVNHLGGWYVPGNDTAERIEVNPISGGTWLVSWTESGGGRYEESGTLETLARPQRIRWRLHLSGPAGPDCDTWLDLGLVNLGGACRIELSHRGFADAAWQRRYATLWPRRLDALLEFFSAI